MLAKIEADKAGYEEAILLDEPRLRLRGHRREPVHRQGRRHRHAGLQPSTSSAASTALSAIQIARDLGYELVERDVARGELYLADEIFMTGTAAELTPMREIDDQPVGNGEPRPDHARGPGRLRGRAARPLGALRRLERRGARPAPAP